MKRVIYLAGSALAALAVLVVSCEEDTPEVDPLIGSYFFTSATFNDSVTIRVQGYEVLFPPESNAAAFVGPGLLAAAPCDNPENAAIELKEGGTMYYACVGEENEEQMGTWKINNARDELTLNISNPQAFSLTVQGLQIAATEFSGTVTNFPLPIDAGEELGALLPGGIPNYQIASVDLVFTRIP